MLRTLLVALVAANLLFFAFTRGWFDGVLGLRSLGDREPERLAAQVRPEAIRVRPVPAAASAPVAAAPSCYEAGPFTAAESAAVESALRAALPAGAWVDNRIDTPATGGIVVASHVFRVAAADAALAARLVGLRLDAGGRTFAPCRADRR